MTRQQWPLELVERLRPLFEHAGHALPPHIRVSCGWPTERAPAPNGSNRSIGQCFSTACSADEGHELFISAALYDKQRVAETLAHELCHAVDNCRHGPEFRRIAMAVGLQGKMTATVAGPQPRERLNALLEREVLMTAREELHKLVDHIPEDDVAAARKILRSLVDPVELSLLTAPPDDEPKRRGTPGSRRDIERSAFRRPAPRGPARVRPVSRFSSRKPPAAPSALRQ
jgi:hypothetical protein